MSIFYKLLLANTCRLLDNTVLALLDRNVTAYLCFTIGCSVFYSGAWCAAETEMRSLHLIPKPTSCTPGIGCFEFKSDTRIFCDEKSKASAELLHEQLSRSFGYPLPVEVFASDIENIRGVVLQVNPNVDELGKEGYHLTVTTEQARIEAPTTRGLFYGCQTLRCLLPQDALSPVVVHNIQFKIRCVDITDSPRFQWRGLMLDCSRTFQTVDYIKKTIDRMALFKLNVLHLHLTDDQGWRLKIDAYPELTEKGARFAQGTNQPTRFEGFYTKDDMRDLIQYAARQGVLVVPEIEMPGHTIAVLACYPQLSCTGGPYEIRPHTGHGPELFCAGNEGSFEFLKNVLSEVIALFPSPYIHIGGDEAEKGRWKECPKCQKRISEEGLADEHELQSYFMKRIAKFVRSQGRTVIGWEEIIDGGLPPEATVISWLGVEGGIRAAKSGHDVVMAPCQYYYLDFSYDHTPTKRVYEFNPVPAELTAEESKHIIGVQACFWSHIDREPALADRQIYPRLLAIAERAWSKRNAQDWEDFHNRLLRNLNKLAFLGIQYHLEPPE